MITAWHLAIIGFNLLWFLFVITASTTLFHPLADNVLLETLVLEIVAMVIYLCLLFYLSFIALSHKDFLSSIIIL